MDGHVSSNLGDGGNDAEDENGQDAVAGEDESWTALREDLAGTDEETTRLAIVRCRCFVDVTYPVPIVPPSAII